MSHRIAEIVDLLATSNEPHRAELSSFILDGAGDWRNTLASSIENALKEKDPTKLIPPLHGALLKNEQDVHLFERLAFLARREGAGSRPGQ